MSNSGQQDLRSAIRKEVQKILFESGEPNMEIEFKKFLAENLDKQTAMSVGSIMDNLLDTLEKSGPQIKKAIDAAIQAASQKDPSIKADRVYAIYKILVTQALGIQNL